MTKENNNYEQWLYDDRLDKQLRQELVDLLAKDAKDELTERFAGDLEFGTGGLRAKMGVGTNRLNMYTVRKATYGVVRWIQRQFEEKEQKIVVGYDGRNHSAEFAHEVASVAAAHGVLAYVYPAARPTPMLSFAVRQLGCSAGVMITASHNPAEYNGYKVYGADGGQVLPDAAEQIVRYTKEVDDLFAVPVMAFVNALHEGWVQMVDTSVEEAYFAALRPLYRDLSQESKDITIVYTPLHGTGGAAVPKALHEAGFTNVVLVDQQAYLDGDFTHVKNPNPEEYVAYDLALETAQQVSADVIMATDPDADRVGVMARDKMGNYIFFSGNEIGALLLSDYLPELVLQGKIAEGSVMVTTNVTSDFGETIAKSFGVQTERTLTGFKYIGDRIKTYEQEGDQRFVFGYEESVGYLALPFVRDKDSVQAAILIANLVAGLHAKGTNLVEAREVLYTKFGYFRDKLLSYTFSGLTGLQKMNDFMQSLRKGPLTVEGSKTLVIEDYLAGEKTNADGTKSKLDFPSSDVLQFRFEGNSWIAVRPSGTEPKLKVYVGVKGQNGEHAEKLLHTYVAAIEERIRPLLA